MCSSLISCSVSGNVTESSSSEDYDRYLSRLPEGSVLSIGEDMSVSGIDTASFDDDGYVLRVQNGEVSVIAKTDAGADIATRYYANHCDGGDLLKVSGEGYKVKKLTIGGVDLSEFAIVYDTGLPYGIFDENYEYSANELAKYLKIATGIEVPVFADKADGYAHTISLVCDTEAGLGNDGFQIDVTDGNMTIRGEVRGTMYGCFDFLENTVGFRFFSFTYTYLYESDEITVENGYSNRYVPQFIQRSIYSGDSGNYPYDKEHKGAEYSVKRKSLSGGCQNYAKYGGAGLNESCHGYHDYISSDDGSKQPCLTDPDILDECITNIIEELKIKEKSTPGFENEIERCVRLGHNDNNRFCECKNCMKLWAKEGGFSGLNVRFCNDVAIGVNAEFDQPIYILMFAYWGAPEAPKVSKPNEYVSVTYCMYQMCWNHPLGEEWCDPDHLGYENLSNSVHMNYLREWCKICDKVLIYWYATGHQSIFSPVSWWSTLYKDMKLMAEAGAKGIMSYSNHSNALFGDMADYMTMILAWNPYMTETEYNAKCEEFMKLYYGDGWEEAMHLADIYDYSKLCTVCYKLHLDDYTNYACIADKYDEILYNVDEMISQADSDRQEKFYRYFAAIMLFEALSGNYEEKYTDGNSESREKLEAYYRKMYDYMTEAGMPVESEYNPNVHPFSLAGKEWNDFYKS